MNKRLLRKPPFFLMALFALLLSCEQLCDCPVEIIDDVPNLECNAIYSGFYKATSDCPFHSNNGYTLIFNESDDCYQAYIDNFLGDGESVLVEFKSQSIVIPVQRFDDQDDIYGTGILRNDTLRIVFTLEDRTFEWKDVCEVIAVWE